MCVGKYFGVGPDSLKEWMDKLGTSEQESTKPQAIVTYLSSLGLQVETQQHMTLADLRECWRKGQPVICPVQDYSGELPGQAKFKYGHYLTVIGCDLGMVFCQDSSIENLEREPNGDVPKSKEEVSGNIAAPGRIMIREQDWLKNWHDRDAAGAKYIRFGIIVGPKIGAQVKAFVKALEPAPAPQQPNKPSPELKKPQQAPNTQRKQPKPPKVPPSSLKKPARIEPNETKEEIREKPQIQEAKPAETKPAVTKQESAANPPEQQAPVQETAPEPQEEGLEKAPEDLYARPAASKKPQEAPEEEAADRTNIDLDRVAEKVEPPKLLEDAKLSLEELEQLLVKSKRPERELARIAKPVGAVNTHSMAMQEQMVGVNLDGMNLLWNPEGGTEESLRAVVQAMRQINIPPQLRVATKNFIITSQPSEDEGVYGQADLTTLATAANQTVVFYGNLKDFAKYGVEEVGSKVVHELAHNMAEWAFGRGMNPGEHSPFGKAAQEEGPTTQYSAIVGKAEPRSFLVEDFAESVAYYVMDREGFEQRLPKKFAAIAGIMAERSRMYNRVANIQRQREAAAARPAGAYRPDEAPKFDRNTVTQMIQQGDWHQLHDYLEETNPEGKEPLLRWNSAVPMEPDYEDSQPWYELDSTGNYGINEWDSEKDTFRLYDISNGVPTGVFVGSLEQCEREADNRLRRRINREIGQG